MPQKDMRLVNPPKDMEGVLSPAAGEYALTGGGDLSYRCGGCKSRLIRDVAHSDVCGAFSAVKCPKCGRFNDLPPEDHHHHHH
ncbi:hypothetical protein GC169_03490 [bacterium]|nr:hypothetical protein [bacterium]